MVQIVLVRAYGDEPLERVLIEACGGVAFVAHPSSISRIAAGQTSPMGFPLSDVFPFDAEQYRLLRSEWSRGESTGWSRCQPLRIYKG